MAELVFAFASSHGPQLSLRPEQWEMRADVDRTRRHIYRGETYSWAELAKMRGMGRVMDLSTEAARAAHYDRSQKALDVLAEQLAAARPDALVIVGDDQDEWFDGTIQPALAIITADEVVNRAYDPADYKAGSGLEFAARGWRPEEDRSYVIDQALAAQLIDRAIEEEFDVTVCKKSPEDEKGPLCINHSVGFIVERLMRGNRIPIVPVLQNTFYQPNQIKSGRAYQFGRMIARAIKGWGGEYADRRIAVCASGGLSHYVVDEEWDQKMLNAMLAGDVATLSNEPNAMFQSGTSETKNWIAVTGLGAEAGLAMKLVDYVPCYRSDAGTGNAMGFAVWQ